MYTQLVLYLRNQLYYCFVVLVAVVCAATNVSAFEAISKEAFLEKYQPHFDRIAEVYSNMQMQVESERIGWPAYKGATRRVENLILAHDKSLRCDARIVANGGQGKDGDILARVAAPKRSFMVQKSAGADAFVLRDLSQGGDDYRTDILVKSNIAIAPFGFREMTIPSFLAEEVVQVTALDNVQADGEPAFRLSFTERIPTGPDRPGEFIFSEPNGWVLKSYTRGLSYGSLKYRGVRDGVGILEGMETWVEEEPGQKAMQEVWTVKSLDLTPPSDDQFRLTAFGLPEPQIAGEQRLWTLYLLGALVLAAVGAVALYGRRGKHGT